MRIKNNLTYIKLLKKRLASTAVGPSTARGMGPEGTIDAARIGLDKLQLKRFSACADEEAFLRKLNAATRKLRSRLPQTAQHWGSARKFINIFLRGCSYNKYLCKHYQLSKIECWLEIPLDSQVANGLRRERNGKKLPRWNTVISLTPKNSRLYQNFAKDIARHENINRVDLDLKYWRAKKLSQQS